MKTTATPTHTLKTRTYALGTFVELAIYTRMENVEAKWTLYKHLHPVTGRVKGYGVNYEKSGACSPGDLSFTSAKKALFHLDNITGARRVA